MQTPSKDFIRRSMRSKRKSLSVSAAQHDAMAQAFFGEFSDASIVSFYSPVGGEIPATPLMQAALARGITCALPVIAHNSQLMSFAPYKEGDAMRADQFGAQTPVTDLRVTPSHIVCPVVAFDVQGRRLGQGGGYYDVTLSNLRAQHAITVIGLAYDGQECEVGILPDEAHDERLDYILTPSGLRKAKT